MLKPEIYKEDPLTRMQLPLPKSLQELHDILPITIIFPKYESDYRSMKTTVDTYMLHELMLTLYPCTRTHAHTQYCLNGLNFAPTTSSSKTCKFIFTVHPAILYLYSR